MSYRNPMRLILSFLAVALTSPASADVTATYSGNRNTRSTIEVAQDGSACIQFSVGRGREFEYTLVRNGEIFIVSPGPGHPIAITVDAFKHQRGDIPASPSRESNGRPLHFEPKETVQIAGFVGRRYALSEPNAPGVVLADDPRLEPLGDALRHFLSAIPVSNPEGQAFAAALDPLLSSQGVLSFLGLDLANATFDPIDPARFALPDTVVRLDDVKGGADDPVIRAKTDQKPVSVVKGAYSDGVLYLLHDAGSIQRWPEGAEQGSVYAVPDAVSSFCIIEKTLWAVTEDLIGQRVRLWSRIISPEAVSDNGAWQKRGAYPHGKQEKIIALDCSSSEPILVSNRYLTLPTSKRRLALSGSPLEIGGFAETQVQDGLLWLGFNAGEWGGGLKTIKLANGKIGSPLKFVDDESCRSGLNPACASVTGLALDPKQAGCILLSIGVVHLISRGAIVRTCGDKTSLVYGKPYTLDPNWRWDGTLDTGNGSSVAFQALRLGKDGAAWAVASDGVYRFSTAAEPEFTPFPVRKFRRFVDWSHSVVVLVSTNMNRRHSLSGESYIIVPR
jgi:hypothetical protein